MYIYLICHCDRGDKIDGAGEIIGRENGGGGNIGDEVDKIGRI
jgi:hypothetical protein